MDNRNKTASVEEASMDLLTDGARDRIRAAFEQDRSRMTSVIAREVGVPEARVIAAMPDGMSVPLDSRRMNEILRALAELGEVHVIVTNRTTTVECVGAFGGFSEWGDFLNVRSHTLDMHIRRGLIASAFGVEKPSHMDGVPTLSVQFFDVEGDVAFKVFLTFGGTPPSDERRAQFQSFVDRFATT